MWGGDCLQLAFIEEQWARGKHWNVAVIEDKINKYCIGVCLFYLLGTELKIVKVKSLGLTLTDQKLKKLPTGKQRLCSHIHFQSLSYVRTEHAYDSLMAKTCGDGLSLKTNPLDFYLLINQFKDIYRQLFWAPNLRWSQLLQCEHVWPFFCLNLMLLCQLATFIWTLVASALAFPFPYCWHSTDKMLFNWKNN